MARAQVGLHQMQVSRSASSSHRRTLTAVFAAFGAAIGALAGSMPSVMRNAGLDGETFGLGLTLSTLMTVMAMSMGGRIARHASNRQVLLAVLPVFAVSLLAYLTSASPIWFFVAVPLMGACFGLTDLFMNAEAVALEHDLNRPVFMAFHGAVSAGVGVMPVAASFLSTAVGTWSVGLAVAAFFAVAWWMVLLHVAPRVFTTGSTARIAGFAALGASSHYALSVISFAAVGFGLALLVPCIFALSARLVPQNRAGALSFISLLTAAPRILAPLAFGFVAAEFGTALAFGLVAVCHVMALLLVLAFGRAV